MKICYKDLVVSASYLNLLASTKATLFPSTIIEQNKLDSNIRSSPSHRIPRDRMIKLIRLYPNSIFKAPDFLGLIYLTRLQDDLNHFRDCKSCDNFWNSLNQFMIVAILLNILRTTFCTAQISGMKKSSSYKILKLSTQISHLWTRTYWNCLLLYGNSALTNSTNTFLLNSTFEYITLTIPFDIPLIL